MKATETIIEPVNGGIYGDGGSGCVEGWGGNGIMLGATSI